MRMRGHHPGCVGLYIGLVALWLPCSVVFGQEDDSFAVAVDGKGACVIVVPDGATETIQFAAQQLHDYLAQITGADLGVVSFAELASRPAIHVGETPVAAEILRKRALENHEAFVVNVSHAAVAIVGCSDRATLYGIYSFLENPIGCRWLTPDIEHVPRLPSLRLAPMTRTSAPVFDMRTFIARGRETLVQWGAKMGMNGFFGPDTAGWNGQCLYFPPENSSCHSYYRIIPTEKCFEKHPEWFPLISGKRQPGKLHGVQLCVTAPELADEFAKNVIAFFDKYPSCEIMSISPNDGRGWCTCDRCMALDQKLCGARTTKQGLAKEQPFMGDRVFWFANEVARRVAEKYPNKKLLVLAYINYAEPPDTVKPLPNVVPWLCHYAPADYSRPIADPTSEPNAQFDAILERWADRAPHLLFYAYVSKSMWWRLPRPVTRSFAADLKHLYNLGIRRYYCQSRLADWPLDGPLYYVLAKLMWNPEADTEEIIDDWIVHMFGNAAPEMHGFYRAVESAVHQTGQSYSDNPPRHVPGLYSPEYLKQAAEHLERALAASDSDEVRERVAEVKKVFDYGTLVVSGIESVQRFRAGAGSSAAREGKELLEDAYKLYRRPELRRYLDQLRFTEMMGVVASGWGPLEKKGGKECWNSDESGLGDNRSGWATFVVDTPEENRGLLLKMCVWGESDLGSVVVNTGGLGKGYADGGKWTPISPAEPLNGKPEWQWLSFEIPAKALALNKTSDTIGFGGGDSQIWVSEISVGMLNE